MPRLRPFSFSQRVSATDARQDRINLKLEHWTFNGSGDQVDELRQKMALPAMSARDTIWGLTIFDDWGKIFNRPARVRGYRPAMLVRSEPWQFGEITLGTPLFSGKWVFSRMNEFRDRSACRTHLQLSLNPTRFARYQNVSVPVPFNARNWPDDINFKWNRAFPTSEFSFDGNDNWLPQIPRMSAYTDHWRHIVQRCCASAIGLFDAEVERSRRHYEVDLPEPMRHESFALKEIETYFEFSSRNAADVVARMGPLVRSLSRLNRTTRRFSQEDSTTIDQNLFFYEVEISAGRHLKIYAKTNKRIRFEVLHRFGRGGFRPPGGYTGEGWSVLPLKILSFAEDAASIVNLALEHFRESNAVSPSHTSPFEFLTEIAAEARSRDVATTLVTLLVNRDGVIDAGQLPANLQRAVHRLSQAGILRYNRSARTYSVSPRRRYALRLLQTNGLWFNLSVRPRHRRPNELSVVGDIDDTDVPQN
jgi:hypothetical protein